MKILYNVIIISLIATSISCSKPDTANLEMKKINTLIGTKIPDVILEAFHDGSIKKINLRSYRGKWVVLFFYPGDFTFVCPTELKELSQFYEDFKANNAEVVSVSTDSAYVHKAWKQSNEALKNVVFPMLSDRTGTLSKALGVYDANAGESLRASFIVDTKGVIVAYEVHSQAIGRSAGELLRKLDAAIAVDKGGGALCPAGWKKGDPLINP